MPTVAIDCFVDSLPDHPQDAVVVGIDVIRATTTAVTAVHGGLGCHVAGTLEDAARLTRDLADPLLVGELGGNMPFGFDLTNSPVAVGELAGTGRQLVLLSSSGTRLLAAAAARHPRTFVACLRNWEAQADALVDERPELVALIGAGTRGEFREEDQLCAAWIAGRLLAAGYDAAEGTRALVKRWEGAPLERITEGKSARYLRESGQLSDLDFVLRHVADVTETYEMDGSAVRARGTGGR